MTDDRLRRAHHEAAHAVIAADIGMAVHAVSIRPGRTFAGVALIDQPDALREVARLIDGRHPLDGLPADALKYACRRIVQVLAGEAAGDIVAPITGRVPDPLDRLELPAEPVERAATLSRPTARLLDAEADPEGHDDHEVAAELAYQLVGYQTTGPLLHWLRAEARRTAVERWAVIASVASALLAAEILDGPAFEAVYQPPTEEPKR